MTSSLRGTPRVASKYPKYPKYPERPRDLGALLLGYLGYSGYFTRTLLQLPEAPMMRFIRQERRNGHGVVIRRTRATISTNGVRLGQQPIEFSHVYVRHTRGLHRWRMGSGKMQTNGGGHTTHAL